jgi:6-phosphogluconolactonase
MAQTDGVIGQINRRILENAEAVTLEAVRLFEQHALESIQARGRFCVALAGGSTPKAIYERLAKLELPWDQIHLFWGDERCVPPDDSRSNFAMVNSALLEHIKIPHENVHRMRGELGGLASAAVYKAELEVMFDGPIVLDLVHLGLGSDGHTASLSRARRIGIHQNQFESPFQVQHSSRKWSASHSGSLF